MGFNKLVRSERTPSKTAPVVKTEKRERQSHNDGFKPSTAKELKQYAQRAKARNKEREEGKSAKRGTKLLVGERRNEYREMFCRLDKFEVLGANVIDKFVEFCKDVGIKVPRYHEYLPRKDADARFLFEINIALSRMSWIQLSQLTSIAVSHPVVSRDHTEAYRFAAHALITLTLGFAEEDGTARLTDLSVLKLWPVETMKRPSKEDRAMSKKEAAQVAKGKSKAKKSSDEDEDEELDTEVEGDEDDEEEESEEELDEEGTEDEESEDSSADEESEDNDGDDESEDEEVEDEDEEPKKRGKAAKEPTVKTKTHKTEKTAKAGKQDRERPAKMKLKGEIPAAKKAAKEKLSKGKKDKPSSEKKARKPRTEAVKLGPNTVLAKIKDRPKGGPKTTVLNLMPKKGIKLAALEKAAKEEGVNPSKVAKFAGLMVKYGFAKVVE